MMTNLKTANYSVIHLDVTQAADLQLLPQDDHDDGGDTSADFGFATDSPHNNHNHARRNHSSHHVGKHSHTLGKRRDWLSGDPFAWRGRKIRHRKTRAIYTVRQVFMSGRVELQKSFMSYLTHVITIQKDYETYC